MQLANGEIVSLFTATEVVFTLNSVVLEIFSAQATRLSSVKAASIARFAMDKIDVKAKMLNNGALEAELLLRSFRLADTAPTRQTKWREIMPASKNVQHHQIMVSYTVTGGTDKSAVANISVDTPTIIFTLEPVFAILDFLSSGNSTAPAETTKSTVSTEVGATGPLKASSVEVGQTHETSLAFRVNIVAAKIMLLADPTRADCEAVVLSVNQIQMAQQGILA